VLHIPFIDSVARQLIEARRPSLVHREREGRNGGQVLLLLGDDRAEPMDGFFAFPDRGFWAVFSATGHTKEERPGGRQKDEAGAAL